VRTRGGQGARHKRPWGTCSRPAHDPAHAQPAPAKESCGGWWWWWGGNRVLLLLCLLPLVQGAKAVRAAIDLVLGRVTRGDPPPPHQLVTCLQNYAPCGGPKPQGSICPHHPCGWGSCTDGLLGQVHASPPLWVPPSSRNALGGPLHNCTMG